MMMSPSTILLFMLINLQQRQLSTADTLSLQDEDNFKFSPFGDIIEEFWVPTLNRMRRQLVGVHIFEEPTTVVKQAQRELHKPLDKGSSLDVHASSYGHDLHGYHEPPKKIKPAPYYGPRYSPYDLIAPDTSKKDKKTKYGDDPVNESKKGYSDKHDGPIKHFGGFGGGGSVGFNTGKIVDQKGHKGHQGGVKGHQGGFKGHQGGFKGHKGGFKGHKGGFKGQILAIKGHKPKGHKDIFIFHKGLFGHKGGGGFKGHGGGGGFKGHGGGGGFKGHGGGGGFKGHGGGGGFKGHGGGGGFKGHGGGGGFKGHGGGGGGFKGHGGGGGFKGHGGGGGFKGHGGGGGFKGHGGGGGFKGYGGGGGFKGHGGGVSLHSHGQGGGQIHADSSYEISTIHEQSDKFSSSGGYEDQQIKFEYKPPVQHLSKPYNTYDAHANVRVTPDIRPQADVAHMLLSDPYKLANERVDDMNLYS